MKRSTQVPASLIVSVAAGLSAAGCGCGSSYDQCVDAMGRVVPDAYCRSPRTYGGNAHWIHRNVESGGFGGSSGGFFGG